MRFVNALPTNSLHIRHIIIVFLTEVGVYSLQSQTN